jgi:hypothetical protein
VWGGLGGRTRVAPTDGRVAVVATAFAVVVVAAPRRNAPAAPFAAAGALVLSLLGWFSLGPRVPRAGVADQVDRCAR